MSNASKSSNKMSLKPDLLSVPTLNALFLVDTTAFEILTRCVGRPYNNALTAKLSSLD